MCGHYHSCKVTDIARTIWFSNERASLIESSSKDHTAHFMTIFIPTEKRFYVLMKNMREQALLFLEMFFVLIKHVNYIT